MTKNKNLQKNSEIHFILKGVNSIQIGIYFLLFAYLTKALLSGFLSDSSLLGMMSIEIIELQILILAFLFLTFSYFAIFFSSRRTCRKNSIQFWNRATASTFFICFALAVLIGFVLTLFHNQGLTLEITSVFLLLYGVFLYFFNFRKKRPLYLLSVIILGLAVITYLIPTYWYNALLILGVGHVVYGLMVKK